MSFARDVPTRTLIRHSSSIGRLCAAIIDRDKGVDRGRMGGQKRGRGRDRGWKPRPEAEDIRALKLEQGQHEQHHQQKLHKNYRERGRERQGYLARKRENKLLHCLSGEGNTYTQMCVVVPFRPPTPLTPPSCALPVQLHFSCPAARSPCAAAKTTRKTVGKAAGQLTTRSISYLQLCPDYDSSRKMRPDSWKLLKFSMELGFRVALTLTHSTCLC